MSDKNKVTLSARADLAGLLDDLTKLQEKAAAISEEIKQAGKDTGESLDGQVKQTETFFNRMRDIGRRSADQLRRDFKSLLAINALQESLKLSNQFSGSIRETVQLSDAIRKLGATFGLTASQFSSFQSSMTRGLGQIGLSSETAANALNGLAETPVRGEANLIGYARTSGMLASFGGEKGREGDIAKGISRVIQARGGNPNDMGQVDSLAEDLRRVRIGTGKGPAETLKAMEDLFSSMAQDMRQKISSRGLTQLATTAMAAGPGSTKFLEEFLSKSPIQRMALEAQGFKGVFTDKGLDIDKFRSASKDVMGRIGGDPRMAASTLGISEEAAEGFVRLANSLDRVKEAQDRVNAATGNLESSYRESLGLGEAFRANINRIKRVFAEPLSAATQGISGLLGKASESDIGSGAVVAGGGVLAALLAGYGLRGVGKGLGGSILKGSAAEALTGEKTIPVYVTNAHEIGLAGGASSLLGGGKLLKGAGALAAGATSLGLAAGVGYFGGSYVGSQLEKTEFGDKMYDKLSDLLLAFAQSWTRGRQSGPIPETKVKVELNKRELKEAKAPSRGASIGP